MKSFFANYSFIFLVLVLITSSCIDDDAIQKSDLLGRWMIETGYRDGNPTESLSGLFFEFREENKLLTNMNLTGEEEICDFDLDGNTIFQQNGSLNVDYNIELFKTDSLILTTELRKKKMKFVLYRAMSKE